MMHCIFNFSIFKFESIQIENNESVIAIHFAVRPTSYSGLTLILRQLQRKSKKGLKLITKRDYQWKIRSPTKKIKQNRAT